MKNVKICNKNQDFLENSSPQLERKVEPWILKNFMLQSNDCRSEIWNSQDRIQKIVADAPLIFRDARVPIRGYFKSWQLSKKSSQDIGCKYLHHSTFESYSKAYTSNLTQDQWEVTEPLIPPAKPGCRPHQMEIWEVLNAIYYLLTQGYTWRNQPRGFAN